jgi:MFS family permease
MSGSAVAELPLAQLQRRTLRILVVAQVLSGVGLTAGITVGGLLGEELMVGGVATVIATATGWVALFLIGMLIYGAGTATNLLVRYAGTDLAAPEHRGRAISTVMVATTIGAVAGPNLVDVAGDVASRLGINPLAGSFIFAVVAYGAASAVIFTWLRPDPLLVARAHAEAHAVASRAAAGDAQEEERPVDWGRIAEATSILILAQLVMLAVMTMTPVFMRDHRHTLGATGFVISAHVAAMFLPSPLTGRLVDRVGRRPTMAAGGIVLISAGLVAAAAPPSSLPVIALALILLGFGWNLAVVGGTAHITDAAPIAKRARIQGASDVGLAIAGSVGGLSSGLIVQAESYAVLGQVSSLAAALALPILLAAALRTRAAG